MAVFALTMYMLTTLSVNCYQRTWICQLISTKLKEHWVNQKINFDFL